MVLGIGATAAVDCSIHLPCLMLHTLHGISLLYVRARGFPRIQSASSRTCLCGLPGNWQIRNQYCSRESLLEMASLVAMMVTKEPSGLFALQCLHLGSV